MPKAASGPHPAAPKATFSSKLRPLNMANAYERELLLVSMLGGAAFYYTALVSYSPLDPSWLTVSVPPALAENLAGAIGADLAAASIYALGLVAWLLPAPWLAGGLMLVQRREHALGRARLCGWILLLSAFATALALRVPFVPWHGFDLPSGGALGQLLGELILRSLGRFGGWIVLTTLALIGLLLISRRSVLHGTAAATAWLGHRWRAKRNGHQQATNEAPLHAVAALSTPSEGAPLASPGVWAYRSPPEPVVFARDPMLDVQPSSERLKVVDVAADKHQYAPPPLSVFLHADPAAAAAVNPRDLEATAQLLVKTFADFGVEGAVIGYQPGPVVTVFEFQPDAGVKQSKVVGLIDDLALALKVDSIFIHPVRGKRALGVQVPNSKRELVHLGDILGTSAFRDAQSPLTFGLGKTISGLPMCADLAAMPHLLMAGATGSGKSVGINAMLCSIIMKATPDEVRMLLVDPKMLELSIYEGIPHLLMPVITEPTKASLALQWAAAEMERRYKLMQHASVRNLAGFNEFWGKASGERQQQLRDAVGGPHTDAIGKLPYILLVIDELADLMMTAPKDVESSIQRLAQKARASGIHMVLATQRPSVDIITGVIKANLPCRIAFQVVSKHDSRTILDLIGAEKLLGKGDMLLQRPGIGRLERLQGALITDEEVLTLVATVKATSPVRYDESIINWIDDEYARTKENSKDSDELPSVLDDDARWDEAVSIGQQHGVISASFLQRHLKIGYNRAARIVELMEKRGLVDRADGAKPRQWLGHRPAAY